MEKTKIDWIIHFVLPCENDNFVPNATDAHTHGMEKYNHPNFQIVLNIGTELIGHVLNELGLRVAAGQQFKDGDRVPEILNCDVLLKEFVEADRKFLRVLIPDESFVYPTEEGCSEMYKIQLLSTDVLCGESKLLQ